MDILSKVDMEQIELVCNAPMFTNTEDSVLLTKTELKEICEYIFELESSALDGEPMPPKLHNFSVLWDFCKDY